MQLLTIAIPRLEQLQKEGEEGRKVIAQWIRYGTVILGFVQASAMYIGFGPLSPHPASGPTSPSPCR
jgi:preprotein translocase subunit SecY